MRKLFSKEGEKEIVAAIQAAEQKTSGEIRVHIAKKCSQPIYQEAVKVFEKLGMTRTQERNGILIFLSLKDHQFTVIGDQGIHEKVGPDFWDKVRDVMQDDFKKGDFLQGLLDGIQACGHQLAQYFPYHPDDHNELPNKLTYK